MNTIMESIMQAARKELNRSMEQQEAAAVLKILVSDFLHDNPSSFQKFEAAVKLCLQGVPVQYVVGYTIFSGCRIRVGPEVLIPRPETEELVEMILGGTNATEKLRLLDIGTGSGCIPVAMAKARLHWSISACDVSPTALETARQNALFNGVNIDFFVGDILSKQEIEVKEKYDLIVSNPPYVLPSEKGTMKRNVLEHEPHLALFVPDNDHLLFYRAILAHVPQLLSPGGSIWFECNERYATEVGQLVQQAGFAEVMVIRDLSGKQRFVNACYP